MRFKNPQDFLDVFGATSSTRRLGEVLGLSAKVAARLAKQRGIKPLTSKAHIPGLEHLPGAPALWKPGNGQAEPSTALTAASLATAQAIALY